MTDILTLPNNYEPDIIKTHRNNEDIFVNNFG